LKSSFESELEGEIKLALSKIPQEERRGIYSVSFYVYDQDDDPRRPTLTLGYNTESNWKASIAKASSSSEAKWNYAFWLQNALLYTGDTMWSQRTYEWVKLSGSSYSDIDEEEDFDRCLQLGAKITMGFVSMLCKISLRLHKSKYIKGIFGRSIPVIIHELEYYDEIADQTVKSNPNGLAKEFSDWVRNG
jgi:hypothetical protein